MRASMLESTTTEIKSASTCLRLGSAMLRDLSASMTSCVQIVSETLATVTS